MNVLPVIGRVGRDAVTRYTNAGKAVTGWALAVDTGWGDNKKTVWLDCSLWGERGAKVGEHIRKGDRLGVTGELGTREHDGKTYVTLDVRDVTLLAPKREGEQTQRQAPARPAPARPSAPPADTRESGGALDDEIPFAPPITRRNWACF
jgi:single-strand DNA-binding protein